jgi:hypothetical protein
MGIKAGDGSRRHSRAGSIRRPPPHDVAPVNESIRKTRTTPGARTDSNNYFVISNSDSVISE